MYLSDIHTHSIASGHGNTSTLSDMAKSAAAKGIQLLGITDHGPATLGAGTVSYFRSLPYSPRKRFGLELLFGIELNILNEEGLIDLPQELLEHLDYAIVSMHKQNFRPLSLEKNTLAFLNAMKNPKIKVLGHCDNPEYPVDYEILAQCAKEHGVLFEINEASLRPDSYRGNTRANATELLRVCKKYQVPIVLSSDSHGADRIGEFTYADAFVHEQVFPEHLILNNQISKLKYYLTRVNE